MANKMEGLMTVMSGGPPKKRRFIISKQAVGKTSEAINNSEMESFSQEIKTIKTALDNLSSKVDLMDQKVSTVLNKCVEIVGIVSNLESAIRSVQITSYEDEIIQEQSTKVLFNTNIGTKPTNQPQNLNFTESCQVLTLNCEADHPSGSWLGNPNQPEQRVRVALKQPDLANIEKQATSPEKMALALLEALFSREVLAESNLSGKGKHKKKQLDPLLLFGIYCHLKYVFNIGENDWARIKQNMDAKCRFFWSRRHRGLSLGGSKTVDNMEHSATSDLSNLRIYPLYQVQKDGQGVLKELPHGAIRVVTATPQQIVHVQERQAVGGHQVMTGGHQVMAGGHQVMTGGHQVMGHYQVMSGQDSRLLRDAEMVECASTTSSTLEDQSLVLQCASTTSSTLEDQSLVMVSQEVRHQEEEIHHVSYEADLVASDGDLAEEERALAGPSSSSLSMDDDSLKGQPALLEDSLSQTPVSGLMKDGDSGCVSILISEGSLMLSQVATTHCSD